MKKFRLEKDAVVDTAMLKANGVSAHHIAVLVQAGQLHRVERGVYTTSPPAGILLLRALAHRRPTLVYSGKTAFELHSEQELTLPLTGRVLYGSSDTGTPLLTLRQSRKLPFESIGELKVVSPVSAVADHLDQDDSELLDFLEKAYRRKEGRQLLERHLEQLPRVSPGLASLLGRAAVGGDSDAERKVFRRLRERGLVVEQNKDIGGYLFDGVIEAAQLIVEIDGYKYHSAESRETFIADRWKANYAVRHGYRVLRYSGSCVEYHLEDVVEQIAAAVNEDPEHLGTEARQVWRWHNTFIRDGPWWAEVAQ